MIVPVLFLRAHMLTGSYTESDSYPLRRSSFSFRNRFINVLTCPSRFQPRRAYDQLQTVKRPAQQIFIPDSVVVYSAVSLFRDKFLCPIANSRVHIPNLGRRRRKIR